MRDFTEETYLNLLQTFIYEGYAFVPFRDYILDSSQQEERYSEGESRNQKRIILRHDVDAAPRNSLRFAQIEHSLGIRGTYYFRITPGSFDEQMIRKIASLGHEIGYHYETINQVSKNGSRCNSVSFPAYLCGKKRRDGIGEQFIDDAFSLFQENLNTLRTIVPVSTICMHGSPLSPLDNRAIWKKYDYRSLGITGDTYLDTDFNTVAYLTDTGRRWNGNHFSIRDKIPEAASLSPCAPCPMPSDSFRHTRHIIRSLQTGNFPSQAMITLHPQRWNDRWLPWIRELVWQNIKNTGKWLLLKTRPNP